MIKNTKKILVFVSLFSYVSIQAMSSYDSIKNYVIDHKEQALAATVFALLARPVYNLVQQYFSEGDQKPYGLESLVGHKCGIKPKTDEFDEQFRAQLSLGSLDMTLKTPVHMPIGVNDMREVLVNLPTKLMSPKRSAQAFLSILNDFYPELTVAIKDQTSPVVRDKEAGVESKIKRLCARFKCGQFEVRTGVDLSEAVMVPLSTISSYLLYQLSQYLQATQKG